MSQNILTGGSARHHLIVRADVLKPPTVPALVTDWLRRLIHGIGMKLAEIPGNPLVWYCPAPGNRGLTTVAVIETSSIMLHCWDEHTPAELQLDIFTCGKLNVEVALGFVGEFKPGCIVYSVLDRANGVGIDNSGILLP